MSTRERWNRIKAWFKAKWLAVKQWLITLLVGVGLLAGGVSMAQNDVNLTWINATQWSDGTPFQPGDVLWTVLEVQMFALGTDLSVAPRAYLELVQLPFGSEAYNDANKANGIHCYIAYHIAMNGRRSVNSNESCKTIDVRLPGNPSGLTAN